MWSEVWFIERECGSTCTIHVQGELNRLLAFQDLRPLSACKLLTKPGAIVWLEAYDSRSLYNLVVAD